MLCCLAASRSPFAVERAQAVGVQRAAAHALPRQALGARGIALRGGRGSGARSRQGTVGHCCQRLGQRIKAIERASATSHATTGRAATGQSCSGESFGAAAAGHTHLEQPAQRMKQAQPRSHLRAHLLAVLHVGPLHKAAAGGALGGRRRPAVLHTRDLLRQCGVEQQAVGGGAAVRGCCSRRLVVVRQAVKGQWAAWRGWGGTAGPLSCAGGKAVPARRVAPRCGQVSSSVAAHLAGGVGGNWLGPPTKQVGGGGLRARDAVEVCAESKAGGLPSAGFRPRVRSLRAQPAAAREKGRPLHGAGCKAAA